MTIDGVLRQSDAMLGKSMTVHGRIAITLDGRAFLIEDSDAWEREEAILIRDEGKIGKQLMEAIPVYVGGPFLLYEQATVTGTAARGSHWLELCDVRRCTVWQDAQTIDVPVDAY